MGLTNMFLGIKLRDEGMQQVMDNQAAEWKEHYRVAVTKWFNTAHKGYTFTSENMRFIAKLDNIPDPHHPNAWAANSASVLRAWINEGRIEPTGFHVTSTLVSSRARALKQYRKIK
jgi:hypothetical protein